MTDHRRNQKGDKPTQHLTGKKTGKQRNQTTRREPSTKSHNHRSTNQEIEQHTFDPHQQIKQQTLDQTPQLPRQTTDRPTTRTTRRQPDTTYHDKRSKSRNQHQGANPTRNLTTETPDQPTQ